MSFRSVFLAVVIAFALILAALLLPVFSAAKRRAQDIQCRNNLKQLTTSAGMYLSQDGPIDYPSSESLWFPSVMS